MMMMMMMLINAVTPAMSSSSIVAGTGKFSEDRITVRRNSDCDANVNQPVAIPRTRRLAD